ncbi:MAG TPA: FtsQ-type POTRA domain-containing protein [Rhizomicrobium sp.]|jgi:cell division protein FtsQ|nr:FtsQ-type POTRA domain-containing protein [Rhizomicrobium sp.]
MRSLKVERMPRESSRARSTRKPSRPVREAASSRGRRESSGEGVIARAKAAIGRFLRHPLLWMSLATLVFVAVAILFVSGVIGRTIHNVRSATDRLVAEAGFGISEIHLTGNSRVPPETILAALGMQPGGSIFDADLPAARARIMQLDWIASADVVRRYPDAITVNVVEKRPFALWQSPDGIAVVERSGKVITTQNVENFSRLPKLVGAGAPEAAADMVEAVMAHRGVDSRIAAYEYVSQRRWNLILNNGVVVQLPENGWRKELDALEHLIVDTGILERDVTEIDLRSPNQYFFVLRGGEKKDVQRGKET